MTSLEDIGALFGDSVEALDKGAFEHVEGGSDEKTNVIGNKLQEEERA